jgi:hypothetical protein
VGDLERILERAERIEPSSGLTDAVMSAVLEQARTPPPLAFPWLRFVVGFGSCVVLFAVVVAMIIVRGVPEPIEPGPAGSVDRWALFFTAGVPALTLLLTSFVFRFSLRATR